MDLGLFNGWDRVMGAVVETAVFYGYTIVLLRLAGKRTIATLTIFDFLSTVAMASVIAGTIIATSVALVEGLAAMTALVALQWAVAFAAARSDRFAGLITNTPRLLYANSRLLRENLLDERVSVGEVMAKIRAAGHPSTESVSAVVLETTGEISVITEGDPAGEEGVLRWVRS